MQIRVNDTGEDFATIRLEPGQDDSFSVAGYGSRGGVSIELPLYAHEAAELIELLEPIARRREEA